MKEESHNCRGLQCLNAEEGNTRNRTDGELIARKSKNKITNKEGEKLNGENGWATLNVDYENRDEMDFRK